MTTFVRSTIAATFNRVPLCDAHEYSGAVRYWPKSVESECGDMPTCVSVLIAWWLKGSDLLHQ